MHLIRKGCKADQVDEWGWTAFGRAASKGHAEICRYLMASGVDANLASTHGVTALHEASREGHINTIYYLREMGADPYHKNLAGTCKIVHRFAYLILIVRFGFLR